MAATTSFPHLRDVPDIVEIAPRAADTLRSANRATRRAVCAGVAAAVLGGTAPAGGVVRSDEGKGEMKGKDMADPNDAGGTRDKTISTPSRSSRDWSAKVFVSDGLFVENAKFLTWQEADEDNTTAARNVYANKIGEALGRDAFPTVAYGSEDAPATYASFPHLFLLGGFPTLSPEAAAVVSRFDLGNGALYPVDIYQRDRKRLIGTYHILNIGNQKRCFLPEESPTAQRSRFGGEFWQPDGRERKHDIAVDGSAFVGPDIWADPRLGQAFFVSGPLARALKDAKATKGWRLREAKVVAEGADRD